MGPIEPSEMKTWKDLAKTELLDRVGLVVVELYQVYEELASAEADERTAKIQGFASSQYEAVSMRDRDGAANAMVATRKVLELRGLVSALELARDFGFMLVVQGA